MKRQLVGVGTSISREKNYDPMDTLLFAVEHDIALVQVYLDYDLIGTHDYIIEIREFARKSNITLTCHAPEPLNEKLVSEDIFSAANQLLIYQEEKKIVTHFDENEPLKKILAHIEAVTNNGLTVCLENFHEAKDENTFLANIDTFNSLFGLAGKYDLPIYPVMDFPRLFVTEIFNKYDSLVLAEQLIDNLAKHPFKVILHCIDFLNYDHTSRDSWCALGKGLMPYKAIFEYARGKNIVYDHCILEYEDKGLTLESLAEAEGI